MPRVTSIKNPPFSKGGEVKQIAVESRLLKKADENE
jgi:hypothetical protein